MKITKYLIVPAVAIGAVAILNSCKTGIPDGAEAVQNLDAKKYLGKWYEIARFDYIFEKGLDHCTAEYSENPDGSIKVVNRGLKIKSNQWKESVGEARFIGNKSVGRLKVSFFKPIWAGYNILSVDDDYKYALVAGDNLKYLWILSRETSIPADVKEKYLNIASNLGYDIDKLIWPSHQ